MLEHCVVGSLAAVVVTFTISAVHAHQRAYYKTIPVNCETILFLGFDQIQ